MTKRKSDDELTKCKDGSPRARWKPAFVPPNENTCLDRIADAKGRLVNWPALAQSFQRDLDALRKKRKEAQRG